MPYPVDRITATPPRKADTYVIKMMPAAPGMYAVVGKGDPKTEYRLIVMWVLLEHEDGTQDIIGLSQDDIAKGNIMHQGYECYTTNAPFKTTNPNVTIVR